MNLTNCDHDFIMKHNNFYVAFFTLTILFLFHTSSFAIRCGQNIDTSPSFKMSGGKDAIRGQVPWQVSLTVGQDHVCGGSIIAPNWILSAAHCFSGYMNRTSVNHNLRFFAVAGSLRRIKGHKYGVRSEIGKIFYHPKWNPKTFFGDVMLLKLKTPFQYRSVPGNSQYATSIGPICLPDVTSKEWNYKGVAKVSGWGKTTENSGQAETLKFITENVLDDSVCAQRYGKSNLLYDKKTMACYGSVKEGIATCQGDSGGPLVVKVGDHYIQKGIVSYGSKKCGEKGSPSVMVRVLPNRTWIKQITSI